MKSNELKGRPKLTPGELRVRQAIIKWSEKNPLINPTHSDIAKKLKITQWAASKTIARLVEKGWARNPAHTRRSLELVE